MGQAIKQWKQRVEAHHQQSLRAQARTPPSEDFWRPYASHFRADPRRADDPVLRRLLSRIRARDTVLDVGGGAGRFALPLALKCRHVTVVEPSEAMVQELEAGAREAGIANVTAVKATWEEAQVEPGDVVLCSHVLYGVADVEPFLRKLDSHARRLVLVLMFMESPQSHLAPFWERVHKEERVNLPGLPELLAVLWEMGIYPDLEMFPPQGVAAYQDLVEARETLRQRLYVEPGSANDRRLERAMEELLESTPSGLVVRGARPRVQGLIAWRPALG